MDEKCHVLGRQYIEAFMQDFMEISGAIYTFISFMNKLLFLFELFACMHPEKNTNPGVGVFVVHGCMHDVVKFKIPLLMQNRLVLW